MSEPDYDPQGPGPEDDDLLDESPRESIPITDTAWCPLCGAEVYAEADRCDTCGRWITPAHRPPSRVPLKTIVAAVLVVAFLLWYLLW